MGKLVSQTEIKSGADVFHDLFKTNPHDLSNITPGLVQACVQHEGDWATVGSVRSWHYFHDGKDRVSKQIVEAIDEEKKLIRFKVIGGDLLELYKTMAITIHVDTNGESNLVTWTVEYEKLSEDVPDPTTLMDFFIVVTKDIETHHLKV